MKNINELTKRGFIEIDYQKPLNEQIRKGDIVITTSMYFFNGYDNNIEPNLQEIDDMPVEEFTVLNIDDHDNIQQGLFELDEYDDCDGWYAPEGRIFVKQNEIEYVTMQIPDFLVDKILKMGGVK